MDEYEQQAQIGGTVHNEQQSAPSHHHSSQPAPMKLLIRPLLPDNDPAAGFSYAKAPVPKSSNFGRKPRFPANSGDLTISKAEKPPCIKPGTTPDLVDLDSQTLDTRNNGNILPQEFSIPMTVLAVPFPNGEQQYSHECTPRLQQFPPQQAPVQQPSLQQPPLQQQSIMLIRDDQCSPHSQHNDSACSTDETLVEHQSSERSGASPQLSLSKTDASPQGEPIRSIHCVAESTDSPRPPRTGRQTSFAKSPLTPQALGQKPPGVTKPQRKKQSNRTRSKAQPHTIDPSVTYKEEELFTYFQIKYRQGLKERKIFEDAQSVKDVRLQKLREVCNELYARVRDTEQRHRQTEAQLSTMKAAKSGFESKLKRLSDFLQGLSNDHNRLRDGSRDLRERQIDIAKDKDVLMEELREAHHTIEDHRAKSNQLVIGARQDLELLHQTSQQQQSELHGKQTLLLIEQKRCLRLENQVSSLSEGHSKLFKLLTSHQEATTQKIEQFLRKVEKPQNTDSWEPHKYVSAQIEQCVTLLQNLQGLQISKTGDLETLKRYMGDCFDGYVLPSIKCHGRIQTKVWTVSLARLRHASIAQQ